MSSTGTDAPLLFPLDDYPETDAPVSVPRSKRQRWFLVRTSDGVEYFLHKLHMNGADEWASMDTIRTQRYKPHFYVTAYTAQRAAREHGPDVQVRAWKD